MNGSHRWRLGARLGCLGAGLLALCGCGGQTPQLRPDIVLVTMDTLRADALGPYRTDPSLTPNIDRFAVNAVVFENAITPIGTTFPAHASLFTGLYPRAHGVRWNGDGLGSEHRTVAEILAEAGYETAAFVAVPSMLGRGGLGQGFTTTIDVAGPRTVDLAGSEVTRRTLKWLEGAAPERPIFLWAHFFEAHTPHQTGTYSRQRFDRLGYEGALREGVSIDHFKALGEMSEVDAAEKQALRTLYDEDVMRLDGYISQLLAGVERRPRDRPLWVILTADHGQNLGEHGDYGHGFLLWQPVLQVPLIIGGSAVRDRGRRAPMRVSLLDLKPTILDLAGIERTERTPGVSLRPALAGAPPVERSLFAEVRVVARGRRHRRQEAGAVAVFDGPTKVIWRPDGYRIYDLARDPGELAGSAAVLGPRHQEMIRRAETFARDVEAVTDWQDLDPEVLRELEALGYLD